MKRPRRDPVREDRIENEAIVDAGPDEQAMSWYYYLESKITFPFQARCVAAKDLSPLRKGEAAEVVFAWCVEVWHFGGFTADKRAFSLLAALDDTG